MLNRHCLQLSLCLVAAVVFQSSNCHADLILGLRFDDGTSAKSVSSGDTVFLDLTLTDTLFGQLGASDVGTVGLITGGGKLVQTGGNASANLVSTSILPNALADFDTLQPRPTSDLAAAQVTAPFLTSVGIGQQTINLIRFEFLVTGTTGDSLEITSAVLDSPFVGNQTAPPFLQNIDGLLNSPANFQSVTASITGATAIPEASTLPIVATLLLSLRCYRRKRALRTTTESV